MEYHKYKQLIEPVRIDVFNRAKKSFPHFNNLNKSEQIQLISDHSKMEINKVDVALLKPFNGNENDFTLIISNLQKIRNSL